MRKNLQCMLPKICLSSVSRIPFGKPVPRNLVYNKKVDQDLTTDRYTVRVYSVTFNGSQTYCQHMEIILSAQGQELYHGQPGQKGEEGRNPGGRKGSMEGVSTCACLVVTALSHGGSHSISAADIIPMRNKSKNSLFLSLNKL